MTTEVVQDKIKFKSVLLIIHLQLGIYVVYFLDVTVGGLWWLILVILLQIVAVFMVRGRPYSGDTVVTAMFKATTQSCLLNWAPALLSFTWNVVLPVVLMVSFFKMMTRII